MAELGLPTHYATADEPALKDRTWIEQQWETVRDAGRHGKEDCLLILDEIQKLPGWSETVKRLWDEDTARSSSIRVLLLGSSPLLVQRGLTESLAGRFEIIHSTHWSYTEMRECFGWTAEQFVYFGGYPGAAGIIDDRQRWMRYISDSLIETSISRDVLLMTRVDKPALLRRLFELACSYSGRMLSYQKMLGQLQDAGNTTTLAHYLELLKGAGLVAGLPKYSGEKVRQRGSSPKLLALNTALITASSPWTFEEARRQPEFWGHLVESAVGAALANGIMGTDLELFYWTGQNREVDFVLRKGSRTIAIEVKSGRAKTSLPGLDTFGREFNVYKNILVGAYGIPVEKFLATPPTALFD